MRYHTHTQTHTHQVWGLGSVQLTGISLGKRLQIRQRQDLKESTASISTGTQDGWQIQCGWVFGGTGICLSSTTTNSEPGKIRISSSPVGSKHEGKASSFLSVRECWRWRGMEECNWSGILGSSEKAATSFPLIAMISNSVLVGKVQERLQVQMEERCHL